MRPLLTALWARPALLLWLPPCSGPAISCSAARWPRPFRRSRLPSGAGSWRSPCSPPSWRGAPMSSDTCCGGMPCSSSAAALSASPATMRSATSPCRPCPAASVAFLNSTLPLMVPLAAFALGVERVAPRTALRHRALLRRRRLDRVARRSRQPRAALVRRRRALVLVAVANYALYSVLLRRKPAELDPLVFLAATMAAGLIVLMPFWAVELAHGATIPRDAALARRRASISASSPRCSPSCSGTAASPRLGATVTGRLVPPRRAFTARSPSWCSASRCGRSTSSASR